MWPPVEQHAPAETHSHSQCTIDFLMMHPLKNYEKPYLSLRKKVSSHTVSLLMNIESGMELTSVCDSAYKRHVVKQN